MWHQLFISILFLFYFTNGQVGQSFGPRPVYVDNSNSQQGKGHKNQKQYLHLEVLFSQLQKFFKLILFISYYYITNYDFLILKNRLSEYSLQSTLSKSSSNNNFNGIKNNFNGVQNYINNVKSNSNNANQVVVHILPIPG